ncbi:prepilin-type N-terminal cleavage/methylation domain-containing protein [Candidatus Woesebacteria bacterium]|nr:prepilin-type N-terminal cleavage/methylation domain-containing protein [Candidatus Woesebacteria bacterium]
MKQTQLRPNQTRLSRGFTLIELLAVITIISILVAIGIVSYTSASRNSRDNRRKTDLQNLRQALVLFRSDEGCYPNDLSQLLPTYWSETNIPEDPGTGTYTYSPTASATCAAPTYAGSFSLSVGLENTNDPDYPTYTVINP